MAKPVTSSCPLCLSANDPADMLEVLIEHDLIRNPGHLNLCRRCALAIVRAAVVSEVIDPAEVFPEAPAGAEPPARIESEEAQNARLDGLGEPVPGGESDSAAAPAEAGGALVLQDQPEAQPVEKPTHRVRAKGGTA